MFITATRDEVLAAQSLKNGPSFGEYRRKTSHGVVDEIRYARVCDELANSNSLPWSGDDIWPADGWEFRLVAITSETGKELRRRSQEIDQLMSSDAGWEERIARLCEAYNWASSPARPLSINEEQMFSLFIWDLNEFMGVHGLRWRRDEEGRRYPVGSR